MKRERTGQSSSALRFAVMCVHCVVDGVHCCPLCVVRVEGRKMWSLLQNVRNIISNKHACRNKRQGKGRLGNYCSSQDRHVGYRSMSMVPLRGKGTKDNATSG